MIKFVFGFLTAGVLGFGGWFLTWQYTPPTWKSLLEPRLATPELCPKAGSQFDCVMARWQIVKRKAEANRYEIDEETALALCKLGGCAAQNFADGPWSIACGHINRHDWVTSQTLFDPCTCPRGKILIDPQLGPGFDYHPWGDRLQSAYRSLEFERQLKGCGSFDPPIEPDRILASDQVW